MTGKNINNFKVVKFKYSKESSSSHNLFIKEHSLRVQEDDKPPGRTLFVINIPPYITEVYLKKLFLQFGNVTSVIFQEPNTEDHKNYNGFKKCYVVFASRSSLLKSLKITCLGLEESPIKTGLQKWMQEYNDSVVKPEILQAEINSFMKKYDKLEESKAKNQEEVDKEGWTVVTKKGRNPGLARKESVEIKLNEKTKISSKKKELKNFYTFQIRESKMKNIVQLRKNYEEAKKKVALMRASRKFKPY
ncbi:ribosomal RNA-processing protein 7 homolog A [Sitophilus oryzae]|uniref:Ribosomal RNA-processing protein 7 homolog A n=1 Tax=Sitophilus oryzae TaxID=7048 RepID=A0A6J2XH53_SITOR|nr:ribosomal RNA-processing protein 7 homolog A [Sitophilus oryzae]